MLISRKKVWLLPTLVILCLAIGLMVYGALSTNWIHVDCDNRGIEIGMWRMCLNALEDSHHDHHSQGEIKRNWTETGEKCIIILTGLGTDIPEWLASIQVLTLIGIGAVVVTTILATVYMFIKTEEQLAIGIAAVCLCAGTFTFIALFKTASHMYIHEDSDVKSEAMYELIDIVFNITCVEFSDNSSISLTLLWGATGCIFLAGCLAIAASCFLESGLGVIPQQNRVGYNLGKEELLYTLLEENDAYFDSSENDTDDEPQESSKNVSRKQSFNIGHATGTSKSTA